MDHTQYINSALLTMTGNIWNLISTGKIPRIMLDIKDLRPDASTSSNINNWHVWGGKLNVMNELNEYWIIGELDREELEQQKSEILNVDLLELIDSEPETNVVNYGKRDRKEHFRSSSWETWCFHRLLQQGPEN